MTTPATPASPKPAGDDRNLVAVDAVTATSFEDRLHLFWTKNGNAVLALCGLIILGVLAKGGWEYFAHQRELDVEKAYAAATTPEQLKTFAAAHSSHPLGGIAQLRIADTAYAAGKSADAIAGYDKALGMVKEGPLAVRAQLGRALAKVQAGKTAEGTVELKQLANDAKQFKAVRVEATYHLSSLAAEAGNGADVQKYSEQLMQIDAASPWTQRALALRASMPVPSTPAITPPATPALEPKKDDTAPSVQVKLPGK
ncbi:MAG: hypothetical protein HY736_16800 [Verrucomicrobia bacterium]|nr:hypothetical protein [Verrucomicrobiota bacterium]